MLTKILRKYKVKKIVRTGNISQINRNPDPSCPYNSNSWCEFNMAVANEVATDQATDVNLQTTTIPPGFEFPLGNATVTFIAGWPKWDAKELAGQFPNLNSSDLDVSDSSEIQNANSIVVRLDYKGGSVLFYRRYDRSRNWWRAKRNKCCRVDHGSPKHVGLYQF